ncbi:Hypothetical predicted protein [Pelobates cultripes]|uniref:Uncharacterized protein n=1 Tax=Pelobates cultripes TaxID=61616 RepID=A0AAD1W7D9_PELCU|nr:Hypothetical predicted protein [Pelobates cultripes]
MEADDVTAITMDVAPPPGIIMTQGPGECGRSCPPRARISQPGLPWLPSIPTQNTDAASGKIERESRIRGTYSRTGGGANGRDGAGRDPEGGMGVASRSLAAQRRVLNTRGRPRNRRYTSSEKWRRFLD